MILIITHKEDFTVDFVVQKLNDAGVKYYRLNCEDILSKNNINIRLSGIMRTEINGVSKFDSVWFRRTKYPDLENYESAVRAYCYLELDYFFKNLWLSIDANKWLSYPENVYTAENKVLQLRKAKELGLNTPETIITGDHNVIRNFYELNKKEVVVKPLYQNRVGTNGSQKLIFTNKLNESDLLKLEERLPLPSIFQEYINKAEEYRVTVVGKDVFCASVDSQAHEETKIDWRKKRLKFKEAEVPSDIRAQCIQLTRVLGISFGAIDLIKDKEGNFIFLEINPNGQWAWIEMDTGLKISNSIMRYLTTPVDNGEYESP